MTKYIVALFIIGFCINTPTFAIAHGNHQESPSDEEIEMLKEQGFTDEEIEGLYEEADEFHRHDEAETQDSDATEDREESLRDRNDRKREEARERRRSHRERR